MKDEVMPISGRATNGYGGLGATLVDNLDTLWIMGMHDEFNEAVNAVMQINLDPHHLPQKRLSVFETTIRYLGGLLAAYDVTGCKDQRLLNKAIEFGDLLYAAWDTPNHTPMPDFSPEAAAKGEDQKYSGQSLVLIGSEALEFTRLSQLTGDMRYYDAIQKMTDILQEQQGRTKLGGMWPNKSTRKDNDELDFTTETSFTLGAMGDSTYEYLLKMAILLGGTKEADQYANMWRWAMDTAVKRVIFRPMVPDNVDILLPGRVKIMDNGAIAMIAESEHLSCFLGGMFAMGSKVLPAKYFGQETHMMIGRKLTNGCVWAYRTTPSGIMPENLVTLACTSVHKCTWNETLWLDKKPKDIPNSAKGYVGAPSKGYLLRPEAIESVFYMYRITGDNHWQDVAWEMFQSIEKATRAEYGNAALEDVFQKIPSKKDNMESFWLAETLKYFYLIFSEPELVSLDEFVLNTEAHPFRRPKSMVQLKAGSQTGSGS
jgi:mannosyl-oligosaccharide alpha-1,2-mannosidase